VINANARYQARILSESSPVMAEHIKDGTLHVVASHYDVATGVVTLLEGAS
jgi:carbonic anhydrase